MAEGGEERRVGLAGGEQSTRTAARASAKERPPTPQAHLPLPVFGLLLGAEHGHGLKVLLLRFKLCLQWCAGGNVPETG